jgi:hypothetical protein
VVDGPSHVVIPTQVGIHFGRRYRPSPVQSTRTRADQGLASFEASLREAPQEKEFLYAINNMPHAEAPPQAASKHAHRRYSLTYPTSANVLTASCVGMPTSEGPSSSH